MTRELFTAVLDLSRVQPHSLSHHWVQGLRENYDRLAQIEEAHTLKYDGISFIPVTDEPGMLKFWLRGIEEVRGFMAKHPGLELARVEASTDGQFNFPYEGEYELYGAVVRWSRDYYTTHGAGTSSDNPFGSRYAEDYPSEWELNFTAPSLKEALEFYIAVRMLKAKLLHAWGNAADPTVAHPTPTAVPDGELEGVAGTTDEDTADAPVQNDLC